MIDPTVLRTLVEERALAQTQLRVAQTTGDGEAEDLAYLTLHRTAEGLLEAAPALLDENAALRAKTEEMQRWIDHHNERADKAESRLAALRESGEKVVESGTHAPSDFCNPGVCPMCRVWDEFIALLRSDP